MNIRLILFPLPLNLRRHQGLLWVAAWCAFAAGNTWGASPADAIRQALQAGQLELASKLVQQERQNAPRDVQIRFLEGVILAQQGQADKAIESFRKLVESNPEIVEVHNNLGVLYASKGRLDDARKALEAGMHANASYAALHRNLGDVQSQLAKQTYAKALQVDSKSRSAVPQLSLLGSIGQQPTVQAPVSAPAVVAVPAASTTASSATVVASTTPRAPILPPKTQASKPEAMASAASAAVRPASVPAAPLPAPVIKPEAEKEQARATPNTKPDHTDTAEVDAIRNAVQAWAKAWSRKDMDHYLEAYAGSFVPSDRQSRSKWEADRRLRILSKKSISVEVRQLKVTVDGKTATAQFQQIYTSDNFTGNSRKTLDMVKQGSRWLIARETVN